MSEVADDSIDLCLKVGVGLESAVEGGQGTHQGRVVEVKSAGEAAGRDSGKSLSEVCGETASECDGSFRPGPGRVIRVDTRRPPHRGGGNGVRRVSVYFRLACGELVSGV
jgi:hypothetical protein